MRDIVVGIDRSDTALRAAHEAADLARMADTNLHILMCVERGSSRTITVGSDQFRVDGLADAENYLADVAHRVGHDRVTTSLAHGDPAKALCDAAARLDARAIVVGNRRTKGASRVLGSIASAVLRQAPCNVMVANTTDQD